MASKKRKARTWTRVAIVLGWGSVDLCHPTVSLATAKAQCPLFTSAIRVRITEILPKPRKAK